MDLCKVLSSSQIDIRNPLILLIIMLIVIAIMSVYKDLFLYQDGVYSKSQFSGATPLGHHSVKIMGWGQENGIPYWVSKKKGPLNLDCVRKIICFEFLTMNFNSFVKLIFEHTLFYK